ncbi:hypothetical protein PXNS11_20005 [Stutzerimonas xanthomarina]|nr:hypothetical protein PXNS11_20005 [Stutzerimonas xanthomarina]
MGRCWRFAHSAITRRSSCRAVTLKSKRAANEANASFKACLLCQASISYQPPLPPLPLERWHGAGLQGPEQRARRTPVCRRVI